MMNILPKCMNISNSLSFISFYISPVFTNLHEFFYRKKTNNKKYDKYHQNN